MPRRAASGSLRISDLAAPGEIPRTVHLGLLAAGAFVVAAGLWRFWGIETEDAYIVLRYANNWVEHGALVYNPGEPILALTSPLYAIGVASLAHFATDLASANQLLGLSLFALAAIGLVGALRAAPIAQWAAVSLAIASPFALLWAAGGLETPLLFSLVTALGLVMSREMRRDEPTASGVITAFVLAGACFLTRHDAGLVVAPALALLAWRNGLLRSLLPVAIGAALPCAWLVVARVYYGDFLPTSFYLKTPGASLADAVYTFEFVLYSGLAFWLLAALGSIGARADGREIGRAHLRATGWAYALLAMLLAYGCAAGATHMFYSFRLFVPFLPIVALVCADLAERAFTFPERSGGWRLPAWIGALVLLLQAVNLHVVSQPGGNVGGARNAEFRLDGASDLSALVADLRAPAETVRDHWSAQPASRRRPMRVKVFAAGALPFALPEAYVYTTLASYRHQCQPNEFEISMMADYFTVSGHDLDEQIRAGRYRHFQPISSRAGMSYGQPIQHVVFFNQNPRPNRLPPRIGEACLTPGRPDAPKDPEADPRLGSADG